MIEFIKDKLETRKKVYLTDPNIILEDYRKEIEKIEEYNGRQLLEMLQNADDEATTDFEKICYIKLTTKQLIIANNGEKFSEGGIESLMYSNLSPKLQRLNKVGRKGLGFRSILSWANKVTIKSYDFAVEFSRRNAIEFLQSLIKKNPNIKETLNEKEKQEQFPIATLRCPKILEKIPENLAEYDTYIIVDLKENKAEDVQEQINNEINKEVLLFLNNLEKIIIESPERNETLRKVPNSTPLRIEVLDSNDEIIDFKEWNIKIKKDIHNGKNYELKIAWSEKFDDDIGRLYSYFKTNVKFRFPALIHGTFDLTSDRNRLIPKSEHNIFLIGEIIQLIIDTALEISKNKVTYDALKLVSFYENESLDTFFEDNDFAKKLKEKIRDNKIFPTLSNKYISYKDKPVFYKNNYAEILPAYKFHDLILHTIDEIVFKTINWIGYYKYNQKYLFNAISEISNQLNIEERAKLIGYIIEDYGDSDIKKEKLPNIFIDQDNEIIPSNSEIFLPPSGEKIDIPVKLNLKIICPELYTKLKQIFNSENAEVIEDRLKFFNIKVYRFGEIFRRIISDFNKNLKNRATNRRNSIKDLLINLYDLFISNKDKENIDITIPANILIPIISKNNGETKVSNVYLGKEYDNKLCEILFEFDKSKLVGSPKILGLEGKEFIKDFLKWLGVVEYPRRKQITINDTDFEKFVLEHFPYETEKIYEIQFKNYDELKSEINWIEEIRIETISDLDLILKNNSIENVIYWIKLDSALFDNLNGGFETNNGSKITIDLKRKHDYAYIYSGNIKSYILWRFQTVDWIITKTYIVVQPTNCCISKTITTDFSPLIEIPKINYEHKLFKEEKISKDAIDFYLTKIGVNKDISSFQTDTIYSMLLNLKDIDKEGEKAKLIYREIIENIDEKTINKKSAKYMEFIENGYVFCSLNNSYSYEKVSRAFYIENKTFGEEIIKQFHTIEIDRRKGQQKVKKIFGVKPLDKLDFQLITDPELHHLNSVFQNEITELRPYIYAFRIAKDKKGDELKWVKNSKISLCVSINAQYKHNGITNDFSLKPYEFIYIENKNEIYLLVDNVKNYNSLSDLQNDYRFSDVIAEIYSSILKVDTHRSSFRELFRETRMNRNYILETELDDNNLEKLKEAKIRLNVVDNPKIQFWFSILLAKKIEYEYKKYSDAEFEALILENLNLNINNYNLNYEEINDLSNSPVIINLFNKLKIDISDFNKNSTIALKVQLYFVEQLQNLINECQKKFEILLFNLLKDKVLLEKETFLERQSSFEIFDEFLIENSIKTDINKLFVDTIKTEFRIDLTDNYDELDISEIYLNNYIELEKKISSLNKKVLSEIVGNNDSLRSLIYFGEFDKIIKEYEEYIAKDDNSREINFNNSTHRITNDDFGQLYELITAENPITKIEKINASKPEITVEDKKKGKSRSKSKVYGNLDKETLGCIGEIIVFETLKKRFGNENVIWDSGFAIKANINPKGDDNKHYDIKYKNKSDKWIYVEVKTTTSNKLEFKISNNEVKFGEDNKNNYEIMIVINATDENKYRRIKKLINPFKFTKGETFTSNSKFIVKNDNFTIKLEDI